MRVLALSIVAVLVAGCSSSSIEQAPWVLTEEPTGSDLQVQAVFGGSSCSSFEEWRVTESSDSVEIEALYKRSGARDCTADEILLYETISLDEPLGDRALVGCEPEVSSADCRRVTTDAVPS